MYVNFGILSTTFTCVRVLTLSNLKKVFLFEYLFNSYYNFDKSLFRCEYQK